MSDFTKTGCEICGVILYLDNLPMHRYRVHLIDAVPDDVKASVAIKKVRAFTDWLLRVNSEDWDIPAALESEWLDALGDTGHTFGDTGYDYVEYLTERPPDAPSLLTRLATRWYTWRLAR